MTKREYVIGRYRLQPGRDLLVDDTPVTIGAKGLDILATLVEAGGGLVTKSELMDRVWPGVAVEEHNIQVQISALRKALGSDAAWIVTVPRLGYRFVGPVTTTRQVGMGLPSAAVPRPLNRLFGREADLAAVQAILDQARLVTLAGPGGIGKTRLALEIIPTIAGRYRDGAVFVDLSVLQDPSLVAGHVATALGIELKGDKPAELLARRLKSRELLIVLDNCEQVVDIVAPLVELVLAEAPSISFLATSREPLACVCEQVYRLPLLTVPRDQVASAAEALAAPAVALLVDRIRAADLRFSLTDATAAAAGAICRHLDGLPLAIEMVGGLASGLGLEVLAARLEESFQLLYSVTRTTVARHRSLEATLDWSHALLSLTERVMLRRLAVFPSRFSLEAVEAILADAEISSAQCGNLLAGLVRKSLVSIDPMAAPLSYRLLETIRAYALEKLEAAGEQGPLRARHARYVGDVLADAMRDWEVMAERAWLDRYAWLLADLRASLRWSFGPGGDTELGLAIAGRMHPLWQMLNLVGEGCRWAETAAAALGPETPDRGAAPVWLAVGNLTAGRSFERSIQVLRRAEELFGQLNNPIERGVALTGLGQVLTLSGRTAAAAEALTQARILLERGAGRRRLGTCAMAFGMLHTANGAWSEARREHERAKIFFEAAGAERQAAAALYNLGDTMWAEGELETAIETMRKALHLAQRWGYRAFAGAAFGSLAGMLTAHGDLDEALAAARAAVPLCREAEYFNWLFYHMALRAAKAARHEDAAQLWGYADRVDGSRAFLQINERRAVETLEALLCDVMDPVRIEQMTLVGRHLSEEEAIALALS